MIDGQCARCKWDIKQAHGKTAPWHIFRNSNILCNVCFWQMRDLLVDLGMAVMADEFSSQSMLLKAIQDKQNG